MTESRFNEIGLQADESVNDFMNGRLKLIQSRTGYRFSIDAILLAEFVTIKKGDIVVDLGTGCGIIPLILLLQKPVRYVLGLEIQYDLAYQSARNSLLNGYPQKMGIVLGDIRYPPMVSSYADVVICNPPYRKKESGRINPHKQKAIARHEILASLADILNTSKYILKTKGRLAMIYPAERLVDLLGGMRSNGLEPKRVRIIYPGIESDAKLALVEASLGGKRGLRVLPPLVDQGEYSISNRV